MKNSSLLDNVTIKKNTKVMPTDPSSNYPPLSNKPSLSPLPTSSYQSSSQNMFYYEQGHPRMMMENSKEQQVVVGLKGMWINT